MGSGTTALACKQTERFYVGYENDKTRCDYAINRIASKIIFKWFLKKPKEAWGYFFFFFLPQMSKRRTSALLPITTV